MTRAGSLLLPPDTEEMNDIAAAHTSTLYYVFSGSGTRLTHRIIAREDI